MNDHEIEIAAQVAVDVVSDYLNARGPGRLPPEVLDELKGRILRKFQDRFKSMTFKEQV